ncbi:MAG: sulfatase [Cytophagales bacterium]|nr:sulfatase [Cytophagales bacterium]
MNKLFSFLPSFSLSILLMGIVFYSCQTKSAKPDRPPNVIIIFTDDQGYEDVGCFGSPDIETPHLDQMAREGVKLTHFYAAQAVCSASRAALLTGCYPNRIGVHAAYMPNSKKGLNHDEVTIAEMLKAKGYNNGIFGKWHLGDHPSLLPLNHGFDEYYGIPYSNDMWPYHPQQGPIFNFGPLPLYEQGTIIDTLEDQSTLTTEITEKSIDFIRRNQDQPFFLYVPHPQPHVPLFVSDKFKNKSKRGLYGDVIMEIDWSTGQILQALKEYGIDDNTLVIYTSDNGPWINYGEHAGSAGILREGKGTAWEGGQREPFIARFPGVIPKGLEVATPTMAIDLLPTIAEWTGAVLPPNFIDGKSIRSILTGNSNEPVQEAYFHYYKTNELHAVTHEKWKLYFPHTYRSLNGREGGKDGFPVPYEQLNVTQLELYNLEEDPSETTDIASQHPDIVQNMEAIADEMRGKLGDALQDQEGSENRPPAIILQ